MTKDQKIAVHRIYNGNRGLYLKPSVLFQRLETFGTFQRLEAFGTFFFNEGYEE